MSGSTAPPAVSKAAEEQFSKLMREAKKMFEAMDVDDSKFVTDKNIQDAFASLGAPPHVCRAKANQIISSFDKDGDKKLSWDEFQSFTLDVACDALSDLGGRLAKGLAEKKKQASFFTQEHDLVSIFGEAVTAADGKDHDTKAVLAAADVVGVYVSAHWCGPCRNFTPMLTSKFIELQDKGKKFVVIFVSCDRSEKEFKEYLAFMPWQAVKFDDSSQLAKARSLLPTRGIPSLGLFEKSGSGFRCYSLEGRTKVMRGEFPWKS